MIDAQIREMRRILGRTPDVLAVLLTDLPDDLLHAADGPGTWTPLDVLRHLAWGEIDDWMPRIRMIVEHGTSKAFRPFDREEGFRRYADWPLDRLLSEFHRLRCASLAGLDDLALTDDDLERTGQHPDFGPVTLQQLLATWVTHDLGHLAQIARTLTRATGAHVGPWRAYFSLLQ